MGKHVAVVGAGYAGMAAAVTLAERGVPVTVFESGPVPGGRARRVTTEGHELDNGQHILIGAYTELLRLMRQVEVGDETLLRLPLELRYADGFRIRTPFGLLAGLLMCAGLPFRERLGAIGFMLNLRKAGFRVPWEQNVRDLLDRHRQNGVIGHYLWRPLCVSALNTPPEQASAQVFVNVLRDSLAGGPGASDLLLPRVNLSRLFPEPACDFVRGHGGDVRLETPVRSLGADLRVNGEAFSGIILAVGHPQLKTLLPDFALERQYQPIYTCYLKYPEGVKLPFPMLGFSKGLVQWIFDRGVLMESTPAERGLVACVISAQGDHQQMRHDELSAACHKELSNALQGLPDPEWSRVIAEKRATIACTPFAAMPGPETPYPGLYLAGDYTFPDYPPTLEAAVRSGIRAADAITRSN